MNTETTQDLLRQPEPGRPGIPFSDMKLGERERLYLEDAFQSGLISSTGPYVGRFERAIARQVGVAQAVACSSGTAALQVVLRALGIGPGDEVIVPAFTFAAPALAVMLVGAAPVFADITADTWTIDPQDVRQLITSRTRAIIAVDVLGHPCDFDALAEFGITIIEDAAEAHGATYKGRPAGSNGTAAIFSFHATKAITTGEGGCVMTNDAALADRVRLLNSSGMAPGQRYWHTAIGGNHRLTNLAAAIGVAQMERWHDLIAARKAAAEHYDFALQGLPVRRRPVADWAGEGMWLYSIVLEDRAAALAVFERHGIEARAVWPALPNSPAFAACRASACLQARQIAGSALLLPTWGGISKETIAQVAAALTEYARTR